MNPGNEMPQKQPPATNTALRRVLIGAAMLCALGAALIGAAFFYATTRDFQQRLAALVVRDLRAATGGKVDISRVIVQPWRLSITVDGLTIHGSEAATEAPYLSLRHLVVRVGVTGLLRNVIHGQAGRMVHLDSLVADGLHFHLIVNKDGSTNQPKPEHPTASTEPLQDVLLDLRAGHVVLRDGIVVINDNTTPINVAANDVDASVYYLRATDRYGVSVAVSNLRSQLMAEPSVQSRLHVAGEFGRDVVQLTDFSLVSGAKSRLIASGRLWNFGHPQWRFSAQGEMAVQTIGFLTATDGLNDGVADLNLEGHSCDAVPSKSPVVSKSPVAAKPASAASASGCGHGYLVTAEARLHDASYRTEYVRLDHVTGRAKLQMTPELLYFPVLEAFLQDGGSAAGTMRIERSATAVPSRAHLSATVNHLRLRSIMDATAPVHYGDLGFDTSITGPVLVEWGGPAPDVSSSVQVGAQLALNPAGEIRRGALSNVPVHGSVDAHYDGRTEVVRIADAEFLTPGSKLSARGVLGVNVGDPLTNLQVGLQVRDLGEFDQLLQTLDLEANGKRGRAAIPLNLHGTMTFNGAAKGEIADLDVKGHLTADDVEVQLGTLADVHVDSAVGDGEYSPYAGVAVASSTIRRGSAVLNLTGTYHPRPAPGVHRVPDYLWDDQGTLDATAKLAHAQAGDLLEIAGQGSRIPVTGTVDLNVHASGTVRALHASGDVELSNGVAYGEPYQLMSVDAAMDGDELRASKVMVRAHNQVVAGSGSYNLASRHITAQLGGEQLRLSQYARFNQLATSTDGVLSFHAAMDGTAETPNLQATLRLKDVTLQDKPLGEVEATATSAGSTVSYQVQSTLVGAKLSATGQTTLTGNYPTEAHLAWTGLNLGTALAPFTTTSIKSSSEIAGSVSLNGPLAEPGKLNGSVELQNVDLQLEGIDLRAPEPLRASLQVGNLTLDQVHITGQDTDLRASGSAQVLGDNHPLGGALHLNASGHISMSLAHSFDPDLLATGKVRFQMTAQGRMKKPALTGDVQVQNVNLAIDGIANGLSDMNGTLAFNQDRLDVKDLTATTGGGQLKIGGFLSYKQGLTADLNATGEAVRVRLYGLSSTATANLRLQGTAKSMLLSGNVLVTRFGVGPDVDYAAFSAVGPSLPPPPGAASNKVHLDVHVTSSPQLDFQNSYAKLAGSVDLTLRGTVGQPTLLGRILVTEGKAVFAGTTYELERGSITFNNPVRIDPVIDLDAAARVETYDISIGLHGTMASLHPTYRSQPPLTEADIFNLLALGRTQEEAQIYQQQQQQAGADPTTDAILGGALNATVANRVGKLFGNGSVKIDPTYVGNLGNSSARITIQEPISKQLTLTFATNVNQTQEQLIQLQYQINQNTALVMTRDENDVYSVVYKIRRRYK